MLDNLAKTVLDRNITEVVKIYSECLENIISVQETENHPEYLTYLKNIEISIIWQRDRFQQAHAFESTLMRNQCQANVEVDKKSDPSFDTPIENEPNFTKKRKYKDDKAEGRRSIIESSLVSPCGDGLNSIAGLDNIKARLRKYVLLPIMFPNLFTGGRKPLCQILLFGPPGTGKTKLARALANETKANFYSISSADLLSSWFGESEKMIKDLFEVARNNNKKTIIFIDEIDSICRKRTDREGEGVRSMKNQLLIELDKNVQLERRCYVICATNCPWELDIAFLRRFQQRLYIPLPDKGGRRKLIQELCKEVKVNMSSQDWETIAERTEGYSGSDLVTLTTGALHAPLDDIINNTNWLENNDNHWIPCSKNTSGSSIMDITQIPPEKIRVRDVTMRDFSKAILQTPKTIPKTEIDKYQKYINQQGF